MKLPFKIISMKTLVTDRFQERLNRFVGRADTVQAQPPTPKPKKGNVIPFGRKPCG